MPPTDHFSNLPAAAAYQSTRRSGVPAAATYPPQRHTNLPAAAAYPPQRHTRRSGIPIYQSTNLPIYQSTFPHANPGRRDRAHHLSQRGERLHRRPADP
ncbi:MAG: hypothetical protein V9H69_08235 [Anaerolineae bacterium]